MSPATPLLMPCFRSRLAQTQPGQPAAGDASDPVEDPTPLISDDPANPPTGKDKSLIGGLLDGIFQG